MPLGSNSASAIESSERGELTVCLNATFIFLRLFCRIVFDGEGSTAQRIRRAAKQRSGGDIRKDAVVADHDRRRKNVAQMTADRELAVVAIARQTAGLHCAHDCSDG